MATLDGGWSVGRGGRPCRGRLRLPPLQRLGCPRMAGPRSAPRSTPPRRPCPNGTGTDYVFVGAGNAANPNVGGYVGLQQLGWPRGLGHNATDPNGNYGVQASLAVGQARTGSRRVVAPSLGQDAYALNASQRVLAARAGPSSPPTAGSPRRRWPTSTATARPRWSRAVTRPPAMANGPDLQQRRPPPGARCRRQPDLPPRHQPDGRLVPRRRQLPGRRPPSGSPSAPARTTGAPRTPTPCSPPIPTATSSGGTTWAATPRPAPPSATTRVTAPTGPRGRRHRFGRAGVGPQRAERRAHSRGGPSSTPGRIIGGVVTADLTGGGYNDVLVPTTAGPGHLRRRSAQVVATLGCGHHGPAELADGDHRPERDSIGITIAGYDARNEGIVQHWEVAGSAGHSLGLRSWPMFHQNPQLTGWLNAGAQGHLNAPIVGMAADGERQAATGTWPRTAASSPSATPASTARWVASHSTGRWWAWPPPPDGAGYWEVASDGGLFAFGDAGFHGSMGGMPLNQPVVGMAVDAGRRRLLGGGVRRRHLRLRRRPVLRLDRCLHLNQPVVGMAATPDGGATGWWPPTAASSPSATPSSTARWAAMHLNQPIVAWRPTGAGLLARPPPTAGVFSFGSAPFYGSTGNLTARAPVVGMASAAVATATGWWRPTAGCSPSERPATTGRCLRCWPAPLGSD